MSSVGKISRVHVLFSGRVQGVGFRYTVCHEAASFAVSGFVKNLWNGDVELVAEGEENELLSFLQAVRCSRLNRNITGETTRWETPRGEFKTFGISA